MLLCQSGDMWLFGLLLQCCWCELLILLRSVNTITLNNCLFVFFFGHNSPPPSVGQGLLIHEVSRSHTTAHHSRQDSSWRVISSSQRPLPNNIQTPMSPVRFEPTISAGERPKICALDCTATGTGATIIRVHYYYYYYYCTILWGTVFLL